MKDNLTSKKNYILIAGLILLLLVYFPIFGHLDKFSIRIWDESRLAVNALEMHKNGNWIVTHFDRKPDMWNTKPPLMIWLQTFCLKLTGVNELSVRIPSASAALFTCIILFFFSARYLKNFWYGFFSVLVLVTTPGYISEHGTRTGDYDALVTMFITLACLLYYSYLETGHIKYVYLFFISLALGVLTKGITIMMFMPALVIFTILRKKLLTVLKDTHFYIGMAIFLILSLGYYFVRETFNPGYIKAVIENELGGRYLKVVEGNSGDFMYYYNNLANHRMNWWLLFVPCGLAVGFLHRNEKIFRLNLFTAILIFSYFLIISFSSTKLEWYDLPLFPFLAVIISIFIYQIFEWLQQPWSLPQNLKTNPFPYLFLFFLFINPYKDIVNKVISAESPWGENFYRIDYFFKSALKGQTDLNNHYFLNSGYNPHHLFYVRKLQDKGIKFNYSDWTRLKKGDKVITYQDDVKEYIRDHYNCEILREEYNITIYQIKDKNHEKIR